MILAYTSELATEPIAEALRQRGWRTIPLPPTWDAAAESNPLVSGEADIILSAPLAYARATGLVDFAIVPDIAISGGGFAGLLKLVFRPGLQAIESIAIHRGSEFNELVARIVLSEKHDIDPRIIAVEEDVDLDGMLDVADSALLGGDEAIFIGSERRSLLDLSDEWQDITETRLPYRILWGRVGGVPPEALDDLRNAREASVLMLADWTASHPRQSEAGLFYQNYLRGDISYELGADELAALDAFYRYAFYYGRITDIPAIKVLPDGVPVG